MIKQYVVDAFTDKLFHGNQAAVCILDKWIADGLMQDIAIENNFPDTAFAVGGNGKYRLRWFTPGGEIDLCGHATLATAYVLFRFYLPQARRIAFTTLGGELAVERKGDLLEMEFPAYKLERVEVTQAMADALGAMPREAYLGRDLLCVFGGEEDVRNLAPDPAKLRGLDGLLVHATARGREADCVSRSFAVKMGTAEDPVCGSGHCHIIPYWAQVLGKSELV
ncbi:MAG: PhzF family phenazine biosynthesis protein, partial [Succinivibrio sp.]